MRSRTARLLVAALIVTAFGAVAAFLVSAEKDIHAKIASTAAFDVRAREAADALSDIRAAEEAYVVPGQGLPFWMHKVATSLESTHDAIAALRQSSGSANALSALLDADATLTEFETIDRRARDYVNGGQQLMASDVIFTEGAQSASTAARQVETARTAERQTADAAIADVRTREAIVVGAAAGFGLLMSFLLVPVPQQEAAVVSAPAEVQEFARLIPPPQKPAAPAPATPIRTTTPVLKAAADLAVAFGKVNEAA